MPELQTGVETFTLTIKAEKSQAGVKLDTDMEYKGLFNKYEVIGFLERVKTHFIESDFSSSPPVSGDSIKEVSNSGEEE